MRLALICLQTLILQVVSKLRDQRPGFTWSCMDRQAQSTRQGCVSHSTTESEIVAADIALRTLGIPGMDLWDNLLGRDLPGKAVPVEFMEDNESTIVVPKLERILA